MRTHEIILISDNYKAPFILFSHVFLVMQYICYFAGGISIWSDTRSKKEGIVSSARDTEQIQSRRGLGAWGGLQDLVFQRNS